MQAQKLGNLLRAPQAEVDQIMLQQAFIETSDLQALLHTTDYSGESPHRRDPAGRFLRN